MRSFDLGVSYSFAESSGGHYGSGGKSIMVAPIRKYVVVLIVRIILQTRRREGSYDFDFALIWNSMRLCELLGGFWYLCYVSYSL